MAVLLQANQKIILPATAKQFEEHAKLVGALKKESYGLLKNASFGGEGSAIYKNLDERASNPANPPRLVLKYIDLSDCLRLDGANSEVAGLQIEKLGQVLFLASFLNTEHKRDSSENKVTATLINRGGAASGLLLALDTRRKTDPPEHVRKANSNTVESIRDLASKRLGNVSFSNELGSDVSSRFGGPIIGKTVWFLGLPLDTAKITQQNAQLELAKLEVAEQLLAFDIGRRLKAAFVSRPGLQGLLFMKSKQLLVPTGAPLSDGYIKDIKLI